MATGSVRMCVVRQHESLTDSVNDALDLYSDCETSDTGTPGGDGVCTDPNTGDEIECVDPDDTGVNTDICTDPNTGDEIECLTETVTPMILLCSWRSL